MGIAGEPDLGDDSASPLVLAQGHDGHDVERAAAAIAALSAADAEAYRKYVELLERLGDGARVLALEPDAALRNLAKARMRPEWKGRVYLKDGALADVAGMAAGVKDRFGLAKTVSAVKGVRGVRKHHLVHNGYVPKMEIDPQTYAVRADGQLLTCEPATVLPMAQRYFLF